MASFTRSDRVAGLLRRELSLLIRNEIRDPRLIALSISDMTVTRDIAYADVYVNLSDDSDIKQQIKLLKNAAGFLRRQLSHQLKMRSVPELRFHYDSSLANANRLNSLIDQARATDSDQDDD